MTMSVSTTNMPVLASENGLSDYLQKIRSFPVLTHEEEYMLAKRWQEHEDIEAAHRMVLSHLRLVAKMAIGFRHYGLPLADLVSEGNLGLMRAVKKFDPERGFRLSTYAMWWIRAALYEYVLSSWSMVRLGALAAHKKLFFNLRRVKAKLNLLDAGPLSDADIAQIAAELDVPEAEVNLMDQRLMGRDSSLNTPIGDDFSMERQDLLVDIRPDQEEMLGRRQEIKLNQKWLAEGMKNLNEREQDILTNRRLRDDPMTLEDLGNRYGISRERVRQLEVRAFSKLQNAVLASSQASIAASNQAVAQKNDAPAIA